MATLDQFPPAAQNQATLGSIPGVRFTEGVTFAVDGPDAVGPEAASAVLVLHDTLDRDDKAQQFWARVADTLKEARDSTGFIRFIAFADGLSNYAIGFWRTHDDAVAYARSRSHQEASKELHETGNQYGHFGGLFQTERPHDRHVFCEVCGSKNRMPTKRCGKCGNELVDVFKVQAAPG